MKIEDYPVSKVLSKKMLIHNYVLGIIRPDREYITWVIVNAIPMFSNDNELEKIVVNFVDITSQKQADEALRDSEKNYRLLIENQTDMVVKFNTEGELLFVSPSYCKTFDKTQDELLGKKFLPLIHEDDRENAEKAIGKVYQPPYTGYVEERAKTKDGWRWQAWLNTAVLE